MNPIAAAHEHLDGSLEIETLIDEARTQGVKLPAYTPAALAKALRCGQKMDLGFYVTVPFATTLSVMQTPEALERIAYELVQAWHRDGIRYGEMRFMPTLHRQKGLRVEEVMEAVLSGMQRGYDQYRIESGLIVCSMRHVSVNDTRDNIDAAIAYRDHGVVAVDMAGDDNLPGLEHAVHYRRAADAGIPSTIHCAEAGPPERVWEALAHFGDVRRIGHGLRVGEDPRLVEELIWRDIPLEVCPTSNVQIGMTPSIEAHPAQGYYRQGLPIMINCDNRLLAGVTLHSEFAAITKAWNLERNDVASMIKDAIDYSFANDDLKESLNEELECWRSTP